MKLLTERESGHIDSINVTMTGYKAHHNVALLYQDMERWGDAECQWRLVLDRAPDFVPSRLGLMELYARTGRLAEAEQIRAKFAG